MPIFDYKCRGCGKKFEALVLKNSVPECPKCQSKELDQQISSFAVSSESISHANLQAAKRRHANSSLYKDKKIAEAEEVREHYTEHYSNE